MFKTLLKASVLSIAAFAAISCSDKPKDGVHRLHVLTTNDVHGRYFDDSYVGDQTRNSLFAINALVTKIREEVGEENTVLIDAGDFLQGDNAAYYYNYVETGKPHVFSRMAKYMKYDAITVGNHDIETGHPVYDRIAKELKSYGIPLLAGNAIRTDNGKPYFPTYTVVKRGGVKVAILGFTNPNMKAWLTESLWEGMTFENLIPLVQREVNKVIKKEKPQVVIVSVHSGTGDGDGSILESQGEDLFLSLKGVDFVICSHDHSAVVMDGTDIALINSGSHARNLGYGYLQLETKNGKVTRKSYQLDNIPVEASEIDQQMKDAFKADFEAVKAFTTREVGELKSDLVTREAFKGMSDYVNLVHTLQLGCKPAEISIAAPLTSNGVVKAGTLIYNDLFTIYPYENQLFVITMTGKEIKDYLEYSYENWINTVGLNSKNGHVLKIASRENNRYSFVGATFNFDSAAGICYTVDVTKPYGERINIQSMADGSAYDMAREYKVAMTSYRASGGGNLLKEGAHVDSDNIDQRVVERYPEIRDILYDYIQANGAIDPAKISDPSVIGHWEFIPESIAKPGIEEDTKLLYR